LLAGLKSGLHVFDVSLTEWSHLGPIVGEPVENRLNDACVDPAGRVYFGSMDDGEEVASGRFYRFSRGIVEPFGPAGICITNGPAVSADGKRIYFTDTLGKKILTAAITADGGLGPIKLFVDTVRDFPEAYPDGPVCDAQGGVWTGLWNGWGVAHYAADGSLIEKIDLPVANITKLAFGGRDLNRLFVTTARKGLDPAALAAQPMAGDLFSFDSAVQGVVSARVQLG
jgi:sugar lactone lactonase YvrE